MARKELSVELREITGKKVATLRRAGLTPGNVYGRGIPSISVQIDHDTLQRTIRSSTANEVLDLKVKGERAPRSVVIHKIQRNPLNSSYLHADFYQVSLREKMRADVPLVIVGTSDAIETYNGVLVHATEILHIEALPLDIPSTIEVDISNLTELEATIHVRDLVVPGNITVLSDPDIAVVKIASPRVSTEDEEPVAAGTTATTDEAAAETETSPEGRETASEGATAAAE